MSEEYIQIKIGAVLVGILAGFIASLWSILPFFVAGIANLFFITTISGFILVLIYSLLKKDTFIKSGIFAIITFFLLSYLIIPTVSTTATSSGNLSSSDYSASGYSTLKLELPGIFCQGCAFSSEGALKSIEGVIDARIDFSTKIATVIYDPNKVSPQTIVSNSLIQAYGGVIVE